MWECVFSCLGNWWQWWRGQNGGAESRPELSLEPSLAVRSWIGHSATLIPNHRDSTNISKSDHNSPPLKPFGDSRDGAQGPQGHLPPPTSHHPLLHGPPSTPQMHQVASCLGVYIYAVLPGMFFLQLISAYLCEF